MERFQRLNVISTELCNWQQTPAKYELDYFNESSIKFTANLVLSVSEWPAMHGMDIALADW